MASTEHHEMHHWRSCIYLNNAGVSFLIKGEFVWALETYQASLTIVSCLTRSTPITINVPEILARTVQRLVSPGVAPSPERARLDVVPLDSALNTMTKFILRDEDCTYTVVPINEIESEAIEQHIYEIVPAILLMNHAAVVLSSRSEVGQNCPLAVRTLRLLHMALDILGLRESATMIAMPPCHLLAISAILHIIATVHRETLSYQQLAETQHQLAFLKQVAMKFDMPMSGAHPGAA